MTTPLGGRPAPTPSRIHRDRALMAEGAAHVARERAAGRRKARSMSDLYPDTLREEYAGKLAAAYLAVAEVHDEFARAYRERQHDAETHERGEQVAS